MSNKAYMVKELSAKLPDLLWRMTKLKLNLHLKCLPEGLFTYTYDYTPQSCIDEITEELNVLANQSNQRSAYFLANRIARKINVLVRLCRIQEKKLDLQAPVKTFSIQAMSTRQQWLQTLEQDIHFLNEQQPALMARMERAKKEQDQQLILTLQMELGDLEKQMTLLKETWAKATTY